MKTLTVIIAYVNKFIFILTFSIASVIKVTQRFCRLKLLPVLSETLLKIHLDLLLKLTYLYIYHAQVLKRNCNLSLRNLET